MNEKTIDPHLAELAVKYVSAAHGLSKDNWDGDGGNFRFTADGHTVEVSFAGVDTGEELGWRIIENGVVVKEEELDEDDNTVGPSAFEEAWLILSRLIRPDCEAEAKNLFLKASQDVFQKANQASLI
jgi:hypothetical protein